MKKSYAAIWCFAIAASMIISGCKDKTKPLSERIAKSWTAESVNHDNVTVYTRGASSNAVPGYSGYQLNLSVESGENKAVNVEWNNDRFTGTWELEGDTKLILKNLTPQPSGTGGTIQFTINSIDDNKLVITRLDASKKTGDTVNKYTLTNP